MRLHARYTGVALVSHGLARPPFGPGFPPGLLADADVLECWVSDAGDPEDRIEWRLWRAGTLVGKAHVEGY